LFRGSRLKRRVVVYVDGFNVYYAIRGTPFRWLNLGHLSTLLVGNATVQRIRYFTARVADRPDSPYQATHQDIYLRALGTVPQLEICEGRFLSSQVRMALVEPVKGGPRTVLVHKTEEKGSDVNLATMLLLDAVRNLYDEAVVLSNDSDLVLPIRLTRNELGKQVGVLNPGTLFSQAMRDCASYYRPISLKSFAAAQFPNPINTEHGEIHRPDGWDRPSDSVEERAI
jgi:uncharacterized LabA/DUF88 family protein